MVWDLNIGNYGAKNNFSNVSSAPSTSLNVILYTRKATIQRKKYPHKHFPKDG
jgi:hypothetical protein